jgi:hypothetical protein
MKTRYTGNETQERALVEAGVIIKLGLDVHARQITVCRQLGDRTPQPPKVFTKERLLVWRRTMVEAGAIVYSCCEVGVMGLHVAPRTKCGRGDEYSGRATETQCGGKPSGRC